MNRELDFIRDMFDSIAPKYDFLNRFLSLRQDVRWRREMVAASGLKSTGKALDVACGTCDVGLEIRRQLGCDPRVVGCDFSPGMLALGRQKTEKLPEAGRIHLVAGNALRLPVRKADFDAVFIAFGIRNIMDRKTALQEFHQTLGPGGRVVVLELSTPEIGLFRDLYLFYFKTILPALGRFFSRHASAYSYLPRSVLNFPEAGRFADILRQAGFSNIRWKPMTFGIVTLFTGDKTA